MRKFKTKKWTLLYKEISKLGEGGNADVYIVEDNESGSKYALKELRSNNRSEEKKSRFVSEIMIASDNAAMIPGIIPVIDYSIEDYWYTMPIAQSIMDFVNGKSLNEIIDGVFPRTYITYCYRRLGSKGFAYGVRYGETPVALVEHQVVFEFFIHQIQVHATDEVHQPVPVVVPCEVYVDIQVRVVNARCFFEILFFCGLVHTVCGEQFGLPVEVDVGNLPYTVVGVGQAGQFPFVEPDGTDMKVGCPGSAGIAFHVGHAQRDVLLSRLVEHDFQDAS